MYDAPGVSLPATAHGMGQKMDMTFKKSIYTNTRRRYGGAREKTWEGHVRMYESWSWSHHAWDMKRAEISRTL